MKSPLTIIYFLEIVKDHQGALNDHASLLVGLLDELGTRGNGLQDVEFHLLATSLSKELLEESDVERQFTALRF